MPRAGGHQIVAGKADRLETAFVTNVRNIASEQGFYWGETPGGAPHHAMEDLLTTIETAAKPAFATLLDSGKHASDNAFPHPWPPREPVRLAMTWWIAAQVVRTARQRERLWRAGGGTLPLPRGVRVANDHIAYMVEHLTPIAATIHARAWGIGFTSLCLLTSDVPVQILNGQDDDDQVRAASYWDLYVPLDPHRFLYMPGGSDLPLRLHRDHLISLPGGLAIPLNEMMIETAHRHVFWHKEHDPRTRIDTAERYGSEGSVQPAAARW